MPFVSIGMHFLSDLESRRVLIFVVAVRVESNGKHYEGQGTQFLPLTFEGLDEGFW